MMRKYMGWIFLFFWFNNYIKLLVNSLKNDLDIIVLRIIRV